MTRLAIDLPDQVAEQLNAYLEAHPGETLTAFVCDALQIKLMPKNSEKLLELAGIVTNAPRGAA